MNWTEVINKATNLCTDTYEITINGIDRFRMNSRSDDIDIEIAKGQNDNIIIRSDYWLPAMGIGILLSWLNEKHYPYTQVRNWLK